jgi:hypothetical protein
MEKFPFWHDDILDMLSYGYDLIKGYRFGRQYDVAPKSERRKRRSRTGVSHTGWLVA